MKTILSFLIIALLVILLIPFSGCRESRPDFEDIISGAVEAANEVQTYRMEMENNSMENGESEQSSAWMEFVAPDRIHGISQPLPENGSGEEQIQIGTVLYTRSVNSDDWQSRDWEDDRFAVRNIISEILNLLAELVDIEELKDEKIDGVDCFHYMGSMNMNGHREEQIASLDRSDPNYEQLVLSYESIEYVRDDVEFWIGKDDCVLRQYTVYMEVDAFTDKGKDTEEVENSSVITTCKFSDFNGPIEIEAPLIEP